MSPVPPSRSRGAAKPNDDFEWPPKGDDVSIYELGPDPWQALQGASSQAIATHHRERSGPQPQRTAARVARAPKATRTLRRVLIASAIVAAAAGCALYAAMARPVSVQSFHHAVPAAAIATPTAQGPSTTTIFATYPAEPAPSSQASAKRGPAVSAPTPASAAAPVDASSEPETPLGPSEVAAPAGEPAAVDSSADAHGRIRSMLQRYIAGLDGQDVHMDRCDIDASDTRGSAVCVGTMRYVTGVSAGKEDRVTWTFDLARSGEDWRVAALSAR
jgi:hypothetical protein